MHPLPVTAIPRWNGNHEIHPQCSGAYDKHSNRWSLGVVFEGDQTPLLS